MADYGAKGSLPGYDVDGLADYLMSFNSSWPLLKVHDTGNYSGTVNHSLGYPPFHLLARPAAGVGTADGRVEQHADNYSVDSSVLARVSGSGSPRYFIFRLPLDQNFTAPVLTGSTAQTTVDRDYGFKVTKPGADTTSTDMRDYAFHSSTRSPMVHLVNHGTMTNTGGGLGYERTVTHGLGYTPMTFVFIKPGTNTVGLAATRYGIVPPPVGIGGYYYTVDTSSVYVTADSFFFSNPPQVSVVIFKAPFEMEQVNRTFP